MGSFNIKHEAEKVGVAVHTLTPGVDLLALVRSAAESAANSLEMARGNSSLGLPGSVAMAKAEAGCGFQPA